MDLALGPKNNKQTCSTSGTSEAVSTLTLVRSYTSATITATSITDCYKNRQVGKGMPSS